jgi:hypothetical protein
MRFLIIPALLLHACAAAKLPANVPVTERKDPVAVEAKFAGNEIGAQYVVQVRFKKNSAEISSKELKDIAAALSQAEASGGVGSVQLVAWADAESAGLKKASLPPHDQRLAEKRLGTLKTALAEKVPEKSLGSHNMAQSPSAIDRLIATSDFKLKQALESAGVNQQEKKGTVSLASKGLVLIFVKEN